MFLNHSKPLNVLTFTLIYVVHLFYFQGEIIELKKVTLASQLTQDTLKRTKSDTEKEHERDKKKYLSILVKRIIFFKEFF